MAVDRLGDRIDIHSGGIDLSFPHHDNEIARESCPLSHSFLIRIMIEFHEFWPCFTTQSRHQKSYSDSELM